LEEKFPLEIKKDRVVDDFFTDIIIISPVTSDRNVYIVKPLGTTGFAEWRSVARFRRVDFASNGFQGAD
jgi:hypothetical protein